MSSIFLPALKRDVINMIAISYHHHCLGNIAWGWVHPIVANSVAAILQSCYTNPPVLSDHRQIQCLSRCHLWYIFFSRSCQCIKHPLGPPPVPRRAQAVLLSQPTMPRLIPVIHIPTTTTIQFFILVESSMTILTMLVIHNHPLAHPCHLHITSKILYIILELEMPGIITSSEVRKYRSRRKVLKQEK